MKSSCFPGNKESICYDWAVNRTERGTSLTAVTPSKTGCFFICVRLVVLDILWSCTCCYWAKEQSLEIFLKSVLHWIVCSEPLKLLYEFHYPEAGNHVAYAPAVEDEIASKLEFSLGSFSQKKILKQDQSQRGWGGAKTSQTISTSEKARVLGRLTKTECDKMFGRYVVFLSTSKALFCEAFDSMKYELMDLTILNCIFFFTFFPCLHSAPFPLSISFMEP